jgi:stress responsive alpha/beta barrel protein
MMRAVGMALVFATLLSASAVTAAEPKVLAHDVYFALNDPSAEAKARLVTACRKYLTGHEGTVFFAAGTLAGELDRPVNDRDYDVALHVYFRDKAAHDKYQDAPRHKQFIQEMQGNWKKVRVFDSWVETSK